MTVKNTKLNRRRFIFSRPYRRRQQRGPGIEETPLNIRYIRRGVKCSIYDHVLVERHG
jgi:hypothetical protein